MKTSMNTPTIEAALTADLLSRILDGEPWHADNLTTLLGDVTAAEATARIAPGTHTIMELVLHMTGWAGEVQSRLGGAAAGTPPQGDWPDPGDVTPARWMAAREALYTAHRRLHDAIAKLPDDVLARPVRDERGDGVGATGYQTSHGIQHHSVYHAGQIALIKKAVRSR
jgi:uncharacterized damage-inducible protein DinB